MSTVFQRLLPALSLTLGLNSALAAADTWPFEPEPDGFSEEALLDLSSLNEDEAGATGWVRVNEDGDFLRGDGTPIRFWAVNTGVERGSGKQRPLWRHLPEADIDYHAKWLAKRGVNMVRCHSHLNPNPKNQDLHEVNMRECEWIWKTVGTMSKHGIYTTASPYWSYSMKSADERWGTNWEGRHSGLLFFDETMQAAYKAWLKTLFTTPSPHLGGKTLAEHPGLAIFQIQNEDSLLFWTMSRIKGAAARDLGKRFGDWAAKKYGSLAKAYEVWGEARSENDDRAAGVLGMIHIWHLTVDGNQEAPSTPRMHDQLQFFTELMYDFNQEIARYLREDLKCPVLINAGNWKTADTVLLNDAERYSYTANEVIAANRYFGGVHNGKHRGWAIISGDQYSNKSALAEGALDFPLNLKLVAGKPMMITESTWVFPEENGFESPLMIAAYSCLTGFDAYYWFATGDNGWTHPKSANGYKPSQKKWICMTPDMAGQWPGAAYLFRKGLVQKGEPVVQEHRSLAGIYGNKYPIIAETASFDPNRDAGDLPANSAVKTGVTPWAFLAGPVEVTYDSSEANTQVADLDKLITKSGDGMRVESVTGELVLDTGKQLLRVDAPGCQAVSGHFAEETTVELSDVAVTLGAGSATVTVIAMDDKPLTSSGTVLVQVGATCRPTGWATKPVTISPKNGEPFPGLEITDYGKAPWQVKQVSGTVSIANGSLSTAAVLDANGMPAGEAKLTQQGGKAVLTLPGNALYVMLRK